MQINKWTISSIVSSEEALLFLCGISYQDTEEVEVLRSPRVVAALVLEFGVSVQSIQVFLTELNKQRKEGILILNKAH